jgi:molybdopterin-biosynthesis enzyme MoeA-like protein
MPATPDFKERLKAITWRNAKKTHLPGKTWPVEKWVECVSQWLVIGNLKEVAAMTGVPYDLIRKWKGTLKWQEIEKEVRASQIINLDTKLGKIVEKSLDAVLDRVENGDFIYDQKSGEIKRRPAQLRDVHRVAVDAISKQDLVRKGMEQRGDSGKQSVEEHLKVLAGEMAKWFEKDAKKNTEVIDLVEVEDAVYEEREARLQDGESEVQFPTGEREEEGGEEPSSEDLGRRGRSPQG